MPKIAHALPGQLAGLLVPEVEIAHAPNRRVERLQGSHEGRQRERRLGCTGPLLLVGDLLEVLHRCASMGQDEAKTTIWIALAGEPGIR